MSLAIKVNGIEIRGLDTKPDEVSLDKDREPMNYGRMGGFFGTATVQLSEEFAKEIRKNLLISRINKIKKDIVNRVNSIKIIKSKRLHNEMVERINVLSRMLNSLLMEFEKLQN